MKTIAVQLGKKLAARRGGLCDPVSGVAISFDKTSRPGGQVVPKTKFIEARLHSGELIEAKPTAVESPASQAPSEVEVTFLEKTEVTGKKYKAGEKAKLPAEMIETLVMAGKIAATEDVP